MEFSKKKGSKKGQKWSFLVSKHHPRRPPLGPNVKMTKIAQNGQKWSKIDPFLTPPF